jgi:exportin-1
MKVQYHTLVESLADLSLFKGIIRVLLSPCRDAEVLSLFAAIITKLRELMAPEVPRVFEAIFECTLQMITKNFAVRPAALPELRAPPCF